MFQSNQKMAKVVLVGDGGVGKTAFMKKLKTRKFEEKHRPTIGVAVHPHGNFSIWDCAGTEKYRGLQDGYFIHANLAIVMYDCSDEASFKNVPGWIAEVRRVCEKIPILIVGNKSDLGCKYENSDCFIFSVKNGDPEDVIRALIKIQ